MAYDSLVELVSNAKLPEDASGNHASRIGKLFAGARFFDCLVAFASIKGLDEFLAPLIEALRGGMHARFAIGLDLFGTEPDTLERLLELRTAYPGQVELLIGSEGRKRVFHPKVYVFQYGSAYGSGPCMALVGSANMTRGGLSNNEEFSVYLKDERAELAHQVASEVERLKAASELINATASLVSEYKRQHAIYSLYQRLALKKARASWTRKPSTNGTLYLDDLYAILDLMKSETSEDGFWSQTESRRRSRAFAKGKLDEIRVNPVDTSAAFLAYYKPLLADGWRSGNLKRRRETVASNGVRIQAALGALESLFQTNSEVSVEVAYEQLRGAMLDVPHVGPNIISEMLHTYDNTRFAVMNRNSTAGLARADILGYAQNLTKRGVDGARYARFCTDMTRVQNGLGLANLSELDALFNFDYWRR